MSVTSPPRPPHSNESPADPISREELDELVAALIEEAHRRTRRRRRRNVALAIIALLVGAVLYEGTSRVAAGDDPTAAVQVKPTAAAHRGAVRNGPLAIFIPPDGGRIERANSATIETIGPDAPRELWRCPGNFWCGQAVSLAWAPDGRRIAFSLDQIGGSSPYAVGLHVVDLETGQDRQIPSGAPAVLAGPAWREYFAKIEKRLGCWPPAQLAWSADGTRLAYPCTSRTGVPVRYFIAVLPLNGSGHRTLRTRVAASWPSWSPDGRHIVYATGVRLKDHSALYLIGSDGSRRRLLLPEGTAPAWSPDGRRIAYQTRCGIRFVTPAGLDVTPTAGRNACGAIGVSGPPVWAPDGTKLAVATDDGVYTLDATGRNLHRVSDRPTTTWYGSLPGRPSWQPLPEEPSRRS